MKLKPWSITLLLPFAILVLLYVLHLAFVQMQEWQRGHLLQEPQRPYIHLGDGERVTTLHAGQQFYIHIETDRKAQCSADISYHIIRQNVVDGLTERTVFATFGTTRALSRAGANVTNVLLTVPSYMKPGHYMLERTALYVCNGATISQAPQIPISIVDDNQKETSR